MKTKLPLPLPKLQKKADLLFSRKRRQEEAGSEGYCWCITCGVRKPWKEMDNGHFISRKHLATRYEKNNCWPQCVRCNKWLSGNHSVYRDELIKLVGEEEVKRLEKKKYEIVISARKLYEDVIAECKAHDPKK